MGQSAAGQGTACGGRPKGKGWHVVEQAAGPQCLALAGHRAEPQGAGYLLQQFE